MDVMNPNTVEQLSIADIVSMTREMWSQTEDAVRAIANDRTVTDADRQTLVDAWRRMRSIRFDHDCWSILEVQESTIRYLYRRVQEAGTVDVMTHGVDVSDCLTPAEAIARIRREK